MGKSEYICIYAGCGKTAKTIAKIVKHQDKCPKKSKQTKKYVKRPKDDE